MVGPRLVGMAAVDVVEAEGASAVSVPALMAATPDDPRLLPLDVVRVGVHLLAHGLDERSAAVGQPQAGREPGREPAPLRHRFDDWKSKPCLHVGADRGGHVGPIDANAFGGWVRRRHLAAA